MKTATLQRMFQYPKRVRTVITRQKVSREKRDEKHFPDARHHHIISSRSTALLLTLLLGLPALVNAYLTLFRKI